MLYCMKYFVVYALNPIMVSLVTLLVGLVVLWFTVKQKAGKIIVTMGCALLVFCSVQALSSFITLPLTYQYPAIVDVDNLSVQFPNMSYVVVLGGGHQTFDPHVPLTDHHSQAQLRRVVEGIRLHRGLPGSKLVLSGGGMRGPSSAHTMEALALSLGVKDVDIILEPDSHNTYEEAKYLKIVLDDAAFLLVTSASHMPRALALFTQMGMNAVPAPTDHRVFREGTYWANRYLPTHAQMYAMGTVVYEYFGKIKATWLGRI
jgi:uncharacterized SAM-binding protein YcdF (DUF218 family)